MEAFGIEHRDQIVRELEVQGYRPRVVQPKGPLQG